MAKNLWGDLGDIKPERTPTTVFKEQANELTVLTKGVLRGSVETGMQYSRFMATLSIIAPALNDYEFTVASVNYGLELYPARLAADWEKHERDAVTECATEDELAAALGKILTSDRVRTVVGSLISQSKS